MIELHSKEDLEIILSDVTKNGDIFELGLMNETYIPIKIRYNKIIMIIFINKQQNKLITA